MTEFSYKGKLYRIDCIGGADNEYALIDVSKINEDAAFDESVIATFTCKFYDRVDAAIKIIEGEE